MAHETVLTHPVQRIVADDCGLGGRQSHQQDTAGERQPRCRSHDAACSHQQRRVGCCSPCTCRTDLQAAYAAPWYQPIGPCILSQELSCCTVVREKHGMGFIHGRRGYRSRTYPLTGGNQRGTWLQ